LNTRRTIAGLITVALLAGVLLISRPDAPTKKTPAKSRSDIASPEDCVQRMFAAAEEGDVDAYLDCFTGRERGRLERELADQSRADYSRALQDALAEQKGRAVFAADGDSEDSDRVAITVERVYATRMERQTYHLRREQNQWRIETVETAQSYQPEKAYGTPVFELPEERQ
jgi:hypothetical protein